MGGVGMLCNDVPNAVWYLFLYVVVLSDLEVKLPPATRRTSPKALLPAGRSTRSNALPSFYSLAAVCRGDVRSIDIVLAGCQHRGKSGTLSEFIVVFKGGIKRNPERRLPRRQVDHDVAVIISSVVADRHITGFIIGMGLRAEEQRLRGGTATTVLSPKIHTSYVKAGPGRASRRACYKKESCGA